MPKFFIADNVCTPYKLVLSRVNRFLILNGWEATKDSTEADTVVIGTCAAFKSLQDEAIDLVRQHQHGYAEEIIYGCLPRISPEDVKALQPDQIIPSTMYERFAKLIPNPVIRLEDVDEASEFRDESEYRRYDPGKQFVLTQTGCSSNCPFCPHKLGIGELKSRPFGEVIRQVEALTAKGVHTIVLTGNDTGSYGTDLDPQTTFPIMVKKALEVGPENIHITQINPRWAWKYVDELREILLNPKIKDCQIPIQSSSDRLTLMMERGVNINKLRPILEEVRAARPDLLLRTDLMMGYPTATDDEEQATLDYAAAIFDEIAVHAFEVFKHARIAKMDVPFYSEEEVEARTQRAVHYLQRFPNKLIHRGGQVYKTLIDIEQPKESLREKMAVGA